MKVFSFCAVLFGTSSACAAAPNVISGSWKQLYSNNYVQLTTEIDWRCIKAYAFQSENETEVYIHKLARLHGGMQIVITPILTAHVEDNQLTIQRPTDPSPVKEDRVYDIHEYSNDTLVITGEDNPALFVWRRDGSLEKNSIDIPRLMAFAADIGFKVRETDIVNTYDKNEC